MELTKELTKVQRVWLAVLVLSFVEIPMMIYYWIKYGWKSFFDLPGISPIGYVAPGLFLVILMVYALYVTWKERKK
jgi:hypothetical protein